MGHCHSGTASTASAPLRSHRPSASCVSCLTIFVNNATRFATVREGSIGFVSGGRRGASGNHRQRSHMRFHTTLVCAAAGLALAGVAGCTAQIGEANQPTGGPGGGIPWGASGRAQHGRRGEQRSDQELVVAGRRGPGGTGGTATAHPLDLNGSPQYYRMVRLTNAQWARAVQDVLKLASPPSSTRLSERGHRHHRLLEQRAGAGRDPAIVVRLPDSLRDGGHPGDHHRRGTGQGLQRHRRGGIHHDARTAHLPSAADVGRAVEVLDALQHGLDADGVAQRLRQGGVAGHPGDAAVALLPVPDRARRRQRRAQRLRDCRQAVAVAARDDAERRAARLRGGVQASSTPPTARPRWPRQCSPRRAPRLSCGSSTASCTTSSASSCSAR